DGSDLRFIAADDKTPLKHHVEKWDPQSELALVWVLVPTLAPGAEGVVWLYYGNQKATSVDDAKGVLDASHVAVFHFEEADGPARGARGYGNSGGQVPAGRNTASIIGNGAQFDGGDGLSVAMPPSLKFPGVTLAAWVKIEAPGKGTIASLGDAALVLDGVTLA